MVQARTSVESTRASVARYERQVAQDLNNLALLVGGPVDQTLPSRPLADDLVARVPAGLPSDLLQRRPDILQAEYQLRAAKQRQILGAARAAFFPSVSLTANAGSTSTELSGLFKGGFWQSDLPAANQPADFPNAGSLRAQPRLRQAAKDIGVAQYEKSIETAFQEVADGLAARQTFTDQLNAQRDFVAANQAYYDLAPTPLSQRRRQQPDLPRCPALAVQRATGIDRGPAGAAGGGGEPVYRAGRRMGDGAGADEPSASGEPSSECCRAGLHSGEKACCGEQTLLW